MMLFLFLHCLFPSCFFLCRFFFYSILDLYTLSSGKSVPLSLNTSSLLFLHRMSSYGCAQPTPAIVSIPHQRAHSVMAVPSELMQHRAYRQKEDQQQQRNSKRNSNSKAIVWYQEVYKKYGYEPKHSNKPTFFGPYLLLQTLGEGEFAKVKAAVHGQTNQEVAIKLMKKEHIQNAALESKLKREITILKSVNHRHIVRLFEVLAIKNYIGIVMQRAAGGELFDYILKQHYLQEREAKRLFAQLISGVDYMHKKQIVHRDLKLENLLLSKERNIIITDFGFANSFTNEMNGMMATSCGSPCYAAPELVISESSTYAGTGVDVWSCGVILFAMLCGYLPFDDDPTNPQGANINALYRYIVSTPVQVPKTISAEATHLLRRMLVPNPIKRCTIDEIKKHPWLQEHANIFEGDISNDPSSAASPEALEKVQNMGAFQPDSSIGKFVPAQLEQKNDGKEVSAAQDQGADDTEEANTRTDEQQRQSSSPEVASFTNKRESSNGCQQNPSTSPTVDEVVSLGVAYLENRPDSNPSITDHEGSMAAKETSGETAVTTRSSATLVVSSTAPAKQPIQPATEISDDSTLKKAVANLDRPLPVIKTKEQNSYRFSYPAATAAAAPTNSPTSPRLPTKLLSALQKEPTAGEHHEATKASNRKSLQQSILASLQSNRSQSVYKTTTPDQTHNRQHQFTASISSSVRKAEELYRRTIEIQPSASERTAFAECTISQRTTRSKGQRLVDWFKKLPSSHSTIINLGTTTSSVLRQKPNRSEQPQSSIPDASRSKTTNRTFRNTFGSHTPELDDSRLKFYKGAIDQDALTALSPHKALEKVKDSLRSMGIDVKKSHDYKLKCSRPARYSKQPHPVKVLSSTTLKTRKRLTSLFSHHPRESTTAAAAAAAAAAAQANLPLPNRKQQQPLNKPTATTAGQRPTVSVYGDKLFDAGEEIEFSVEISRIANLTGLYVVNIKRIKGNIWAFKYLYHRLLDSLDLKNDNNKKQVERTDPQPQPQPQPQKHTRARSERKSQQHQDTSIRNENRRKSCMTSSSGSSSSMLIL